MRNTVAEGAGRDLEPDEEGEIRRAATPALDDLKREIDSAWSGTEARQAAGTRERSSIESRADLRVASTNEAMRADPSRLSVTLTVEQETARRWAELDARDYGRIRSESRREVALEAIGGHMRASTEYSEEIKKRAPILADAAKALNEERERIERVMALPTIEGTTAALAAAAATGDLADAEERRMARGDAHSLAVALPGPDRHAAAALVGESAKKYPAYRDELNRVAPDLARAAEQAAVEREAVLGIERRNDELLPVPRDGMSVADARAAVALDLRSIELVTDDDARYRAAVAMGDNARGQANYRAELELQAPEVAREVRAATAENDRRAADKDDRKAAEFDDMQRAKGDRASAWTPEQATEQARSDLASLRAADATERQYLTDDMAVAAERNKSYAQVLAQEAPEVAREVEARRDQLAAERAATELRKDGLSAAAQARASLIEAAAVAAVAAVRTRETARVAEQLTRRADAPAQVLEGSQRPLSAPRMDIGTAAASESEVVGQRGRAIKRPVADDELSQALLTRFVVSHDKRGLLDRGSAAFTFRSGSDQGRVAFVDAGKALSTEREDKATIRAMIEVSMAKRWSEITVSGTDEFRRGAWLEASLHGVKVRGYEPHEADLQILADLQKRDKPTNVITGTEREHTRNAPRESVHDRPEPTSTLKHIDGDALTPHEKTVLTNSRAILDAKALGEQFTEAALRELEAKLRGERVYVGEIVDHGRAPYKFDKANDENYYVTLRTRAGEQVIWGKGLAEAMQERQAGEQIVLQNTGRRAVQVQERVRDAAGHVVSTRPKDSQLNSWKAELLSRFSDKARRDFASRTSTGQPSFGVYDPKAPRAPTARPEGHAQDRSRNAEQGINDRSR